MQTIFTLANNRQTHTVKTTWQNSMEQQKKGDNISESVIYLQLKLHDYADLCQDKVAR